MKFDALGENGAAAAFIFQWQKGSFVQVLPSGTAGSVRSSRPPAWPAESRPGQLVRMKGLAR